MATRYRNVVQFKREAEAERRRRLERHRRKQRDEAETLSCEYCAASYSRRRPGQRYCSATCRWRDRWKRLRAAPAGSVVGRVKVVRRLAHGRVAITLHFDEADSAAALRTPVGELRPLGPAVVGDNYKSDES